MGFHHLRLTMSLIVIPFGFSISLGNPVRKDTLEVFRQLNVDV